MDNIRPIRNEADYEWAIAEIARYFESEPEPGSPDADRFDVLASLIGAYEDNHYPISAPADPVDVIKLHMDMTGRTQRDLGGLLGSPSRASEILNRKRSLTMEMAHRLNKEWGVPADALIGPYALARA